LDIFDAIAQRKSIRSYASTPIPEDVLVKVLEAARLAPSAANLQPWHFIIITDKDRRASIAKACKYGKFLAESPVVIVGCGNKKTSPKWYVVDTTIALEHMVLSATGLQLGTCWIGSFNDKDIRSILMIPNEYEVVALIALGYTRDKIDPLAGIVHAVRPRRKLQEIISRETFGSLQVHS
jgi:nitroreductase